MAKKPKEKKKVNSRFILFFSILALVILIISFGNKMGGGSILRLVYLIGDGITGSADEVTIQFDSNDANRYHPISGNLAILSTDGMHICSLSGDEDNFTPLSYHSPTLAGGKDTLVAYDRNGNVYTVMNDSEVLHNGTTEAPIINISMNEDGAFSVVTAGPDCKALVSAYDEDFELLYRVHSSEQYVLCAPISEDGDLMATVGFSASTGQFTGRITFYDLDTEGALNHTDLTDCMPIAARFLSNDDLLVLCEDRLLRFSDDGTLLKENLFDGMTLTNASLESRNIASVLLDGHSAGGATRLLVSTGENEEYIYNFSENIFDISSSGDYTALLLSDRIVVYDENGEEHHTFTLTQGVKDCIMRKDGTVFAIGRNFAKLLIP